jgi:hypothetical protein
MIPVTDSRQHRRVVHIVPSRDVVESGVGGGSGATTVGLTLQRADRAGQSERGSGRQRSRGFGPWCRQQPVTT